MGRDWALRPFFIRISGIFSIALVAVCFVTPAHASFESECSAAGGSAKSLSNGKQICRCGAWDRPINPRDARQAQACRNQSYAPLINQLENLNSPSTCSDCPQDGYANNQADSCDETLIGGLLADDKSGNGWTFGLIHSSATECHQINDTSSPSDLEKYLATDSKYRFGAEVGVVNGCFANASDPDKKQALAKYYYLNNRLRAADMASIESIASIDSMLGQNFQDSFGKDFKERCGDSLMQDRSSACDFFASKCSAQGGMAPLVQQTKLALQTKDRLEKEISDLKTQEAAQVTLANYGGQMQDFSSKIQADEKAVADLEAANPWIKGKAFNSTASKYSGSARYNDSAIQTMVQNQLVQDRDSLLKRLDSYKQATACLNSESESRAGHCKNFNKIIDDTPDLLLGSQDSSTTRQQALAQYYMGQAQCRWNINDDAKAASGDMKELIGNTLLTIGTAGLSSWVAGAKLAAEGVTAAKGISQVALGADLALNAGFAASGGIQAYKGCMKDLNQVGALARPSADSSNGLSCPVNPYTTASAIPNITANVRACVTQTIAAAAGVLPFAPTVILSKPFLALRGLRAAAKDASKGASEARELAAEDVSVPKLSTADAKAPEAEAGSIALENDRQLTPEQVKLRKSWRAQVDAAKTFKDPTLLPAYGKNDDERVRDAEEGLKALGFLNEDLTSDQRNLIRDHLGAGQNTPYFSLTRDEIVAKVRNARKVGLTPEQTDFLIRSGYAGSPGPTAALRTLDEQPVGGTLAKDLANPEYYISVPGPGGERILARYLGRNVGDGAPVAEFKEGNQIVVRKLTSAEHQGWTRDPSAQRSFSRLESSIPSDKRYAMITDPSGKTYPVEFLSVIKDARDGSASVRTLVKDPETGAITLRDISRSDFSHAHYTNPEEFRNFKGSLHEGIAAQAAPATSTPADFRGSPYEYQEMMDARGHTYVVRALRTVKDYSGRNVIEAQVKDALSGHASYRQLYSDEMSQFTKKPITAQDFEQFEGAQARAQREAQLTANKDANLLGVDGAALQDGPSADRSLQALSQKVEPRNGSSLDASQRSAALRMVDHYSGSIEKLQVSAPSAVSRTETSLNRIQKSVVDQMTGLELTQARSELLTAHPEFANQPSGYMRPKLAIQYQRYQQINAKLEEEAKLAKQAERKAQLAEMRKAEERELRTGTNAPEEARPLTDVQRSTLESTIAIMGKKAANITPEDIAQIKSMRSLLEQKQSWNQKADLWKPRGIAEEDRGLAKQFDEAYAKLKQNYGSDSYYLAERQRRVIEPPKVNTYDKVGGAELKISTHGVRISRNDEQKISAALKAATETFSFESLHGLATYYPVISSSRDFQQVEKVLSENGIKMDPGILENANALTTVDAMNVDKVPHLFQSGKLFIQQLRQVPGGLDAVRNLNNHYLNQIIETVDFQVTRYVPQGIRDLPSP